MSSSEERTEGRLSTAAMAGVVDNADRPPSGTLDMEERAPVERRPEDRPDTPDERMPLFSGDDTQNFRGRWTDIQSSFVDEPRRAVENADSLVAEVMQRLAQAFATERRTLEQHWEGGGETNTEELRLAFRRYRSFFDRLLTM
jgi:hypothetical protein